MKQILGNRTFQVCFLICSSILIFLGRLNTVGLTNDSDTWYAQKAKMILKTGDWWVLQWYQTPQFTNTPLPIWMQAVSFKMFGISAYSAILPSALLGVATVILTYRFSEQLFNDRWIAFLAAVILIFPGFYVDNARRAQTDIALTFFVLLAMFAFFKAGKNPKWYLLYGLSAAFAILSKSVMGIFPFMIGFIYLVMTRQFREIFNPYLVSGVVGGLLLGSCWHIVNWMRFGDKFLEVHFSQTIFRRASTGIAEGTAGPNTDPLFFLGYFRHLLKNYWPWLPFTVAGVWIFGRNFVKEKNRESLLILLWIGVTFAVMSSSRAQTFHYILPIFPALAIVTSKTISDWLSDGWKEKVFPYMFGAVFITVLFINATGIEIKSAVTLSRNNADARDLAPAINLNVPPGKFVQNYHVSPVLQQTYLFYTDRLLSGGMITNPERLLQMVESDPGKTWLAPIGEFKKVEKKYPGKFYLIQASRNFVYFTSALNRKNISYDFSQENLTFVK